MINRIPPPLLILAIAGAILAGPVIFLAFFLGEATTGLAAALLVCLYFVALYIIMVRRSE